MLKTQTSDLASWEPQRTELSAEWIAFIRKLADDTKGSVRRYVLHVKYDDQGVGDLLSSWGLPWQVVAAGYLWGYEEEQIRQGGLEGTNQILNHKRASLRYIKFIEDEDLPPLLTPPYKDMGALLIAVAIYYRTLQILQQRTSKKPPTKDEQVQIESVGRTLLHIAKRLGMWYFKRKIEDLNEQLISPQFFEHQQQEHSNILQRDREVLDQVRDRLTKYYQEATQRPFMIDYIPCGIAGLKRRIQDAHTTATSQKQQQQLTGFDLVTFDVTVPTVQDCYQALGAFSQLGYIQDRVTDQIANPKPNGYSHIALGLILKMHDPMLQDIIWKESTPPICQLQIATKVMQAVMRYGCLHPRCYGIYMGQAVEERPEIIHPKQLFTGEEGKVFLTIQESFNAPSTQTRAEAPIIVFTKERRPIALPKGATVLDFAFAVDLSMGIYAVDTILNNRKAPLWRELDAGDIIEIRTSNEVQAQLYWLENNYVVTSLARNHIKKTVNPLYLDWPSYKRIRKTLKSLHYMLSIETLNKELEIFVQRSQLGTVQSYLEKLDEASDQDSQIEEVARKIIKQISERSKQTRESTYNWVPVPDAETEKHLVNQLHLCTYCQPKYPNHMKIMGRIRKRTGELVVHLISCPYLNNHANELQTTLLPMAWQQIPPAYKIAFYIEAQERKGLLQDITRRLSHHQCSLLSLQSEVIPELRKAELRMLIEVYYDKEAIDIQQELRGISGVISVEIDATATPRPIYERLQNQHEQPHSMMGKVDQELEWEDTVETLVARSQVLNNPFDISRPAKAKMFFGRSSETKMMQRTLCDGESGKAIILYGPRRSGKSSLCKNFLERYVQPPYWHVLFSLQNATRDNEETILMRLADEICGAFRDQLHHPIDSSWHTHEGDPEIRFKRLLQSCLSQLPGSQLVLALDEFGGVLESYERHILDKRFFTYWKTLMAEVPQLSLVIILPTSSHHQLNTSALSNAFSFASTLRMDFLDEESAQRLLVDPLREQQIAIHPKAATLATRLTGNNPYYMTLIGQELVNQLNRETSKQKVTDEDLHMVVDYIIEAGSNSNFDFHLSELQNEYEFRLLKGIVEISEATHQPAISLKRLADKLKMSKQEIRPHLERLRNGLILEEYTISSSNPSYAFKIELVQRWMTHNRWFFLRQ